jgi:L-seryl-tRNA(Ser) seleniumtransferase
LAYLRREGDAIPFWRMAALRVEGLRARAEVLADGCSAAPGVDVEVVGCQSVPGGGSVPGLTIASAGLALAGDHAAALRAGDPPVIARVHEGRTIIDLRTVDPADDAVLAKALAELT